MAVSLPSVASLLRLSLIVSLFVALAVAESSVHLNGNAYRDSTGAVLASLSRTSMGGFQSDQTFLYGTFSALIKLPPHSAGVITDFFLRQPFVNGDEVDFELIGSNDNNYFLVHTNYYSGGYGTGAHEEQFVMNFDPTAGFHNFTIQWGLHQIVWIVDGIPLRVQPINTGEANTAVNHPLVVQGTVWDASDWATWNLTTCKKERANYNYQPFTSMYKDFTFNGCVQPDATSNVTCSDSASAAYNAPLTPHQMNLMAIARVTRLIYSYHWKHAKVCTGNHAKQASVAGRTSFGHHPLGHKGRHNGNPLHKGGHHKNPKAGHHETKVGHHKP